MKRVNHFLDYMWTHPDAKIRYSASDMILNVHSDESYLSAPKARSRAGGYFFLGSLAHDGDRLNSTAPSMSNAQSSNLLLRLQQKPIWVHSF